MAVRILAVLGLIIAALIGASPASAVPVTRYAAPGGTADPTQCTSENGPFCSFKDAIAGIGVTADDTAIILPGNYGDTDLGNGTQVVAGTVRGIADQPRPVLTSTGSFGGLGVGASEVSHLELRYTGNGQSTALTVFGGVIDDSIIVAEGSDYAVACAVGAGATLRNTVCKNEGQFAAAVNGGTIGGSGGTAASLVNVTAINTAVGGDAISFHFRDPVNDGDTWTINITNTIAVPGTNGDSISGESSSTGTNCPVVNIVVDHSNFGQTAALGSAPCLGKVTISAANTNDNQSATTDPPLLAADGFHQLENSPTIDAGSPTLAQGVDIDGEARTIGTAPDIGADEFAPAAPPTTTPPTPTPTPPTGATCADRPATIVDGPGGNVILGTAGDDVIVAGDGDDTVIASSGDDVVCGGAGADVLKGKRGDDRLFGGAGDDRLRGGRGTDLCSGGTGNDSFRKCER